MPKTEEQKEYQKQYYEKNKEEINKKRREYRINNLEKVRKQDREAYQRNKEKKQERSKTYYENNKKKISERERTLNVKKRQWKRQGLKHTDEEIEIIYNRYTECKECELCYFKFDEKNLNSRRKNFKQMEHCHISGCFRNIVCLKCNSNIAKVDRIRMKLLLELHRYFNNL